MLRIGQSYKFNGKHVAEESPYQVNPAPQGANLANNA